jgi:hypothetical protein
MEDIDWGLDVETKKDVLIERINKLSKDGYSLELNYLFSVSQNQEETAEKYRVAVEGVKNALAFHKEKLAALS